MSDFSRQAIILELIRKMRDCGSWCGETHLQKCVYIMTEGLGNRSLDFDYVMYKHGPYSFELHEEIGRMEATGLINLRPNPGYGPSLLLSDTGLQLVQRFPGTVSAQKADIQLVAERFSPRTVTQLERIATALFVKRRFPELSRDSQLAKFRELKPYLPAASAELGFQELESGIESRDLRV